MATRLTRAEKQAQTRQALLDAARDVFLRRGFAGASVEEITAEAGFTRGAFYSNFTSKDELFFELLDSQVFEYYREMARKRMAADEPTSLRATGEELAEELRCQGLEWVWPLLLDLLAQAARRPELRKLASRFWSDTRSLSAEVIRREYERAGIDPPADPRTIATAFIAVDIGLALQNMVDPEDVPLEVYPELFELLFTQM